MDPESVQPSRASVLERRWSRIAALVGFAGCALFYAVTPGHHAPRAALLAALGIYALAKLVALVLHLGEGSRVWLANLCEVAALGVTGHIVWFGQADLVSLGLVVALLFGGGAWRRRVAQLAESESP